MRTLSALSMRRVAGELGVGTMSLYRYVPGKGELLDLMLDHVNGVPDDAPDPRSLSWRRTLEEMAWGIWDLYQAHPWLLHVNQSRPVLGPNSLAGFNHALAGLADLDLDGRDRVAVILAVENHVVGTARAFLLRQQAAEESGVSDQEFWAAQEPMLDRAMATGNYPEVVPGRQGPRLTEPMNGGSVPVYQIVQAPSHLGLRAPGVEALPEALLGAGLAGRLGARPAARLAAPAFDPEIDPGTGLLNPRGLRDHASRLADAVGAVLDRGAFPIVLGGDCTILLGITLALRRRGRSGLLFLDGHADFYQPEAEPAGEAASMELALVTGRGPELVTNLEGRRPLLRDEDVVVFGYRDAEHAAAEGSQPLPPTIRAMDLWSVREHGVERAVGDALAHLQRAGGPAGFWVHLDVDVLDDAVMPAVDYRLPGGLSWDELSAVLRAAVAGGHAIGLDIAIFNPSLDPDGRVAHRLVDALVAGLSGRPG